MRDLGKPKLFLGMQVDYTRSTGITCLRQTDYIESLGLASKFNLSVYERPLMPIQSNYYATLDAQLDTPVLTDVPYKELVGSLIFCMVCTRPDIAFAVSCLTSYFSAPHQLHWDVAIRCLGYLMATKHHGIVLGEVGSGSLL